MTGDDEEKTHRGKGTRPQLEIIHDCAAQASAEECERHADMARNGDLAGIIFLVEQRGMGNTSLPSAAILTGSYADDPGRTILAVEHLLYVLKERYFGPNRT